ncbi:hypothetical protein AAFF_G00173220 [Aldrovandia affinis]|uniref:Unique cartilage matrix-associated protein n=1 Tax=Aldrovandia affinis TaxID=143900 RepID=A0AAD7SYV5_9TELE|nr:hypothetical protein AAFF_G00173220 [Aldrovandia affinis]
MTWRPPVLLSLLILLLALTLYRAESAAVRDEATETKATHHPGTMRKIFMRNTDASSFFKRRSRRWAKSQQEITAEQSQKVTAEERRREYYEEQRNKLENHAEEERDEQDERSREWTEQWQEFNYDGLFPFSMFRRYY